ncbi:hypothetical protein PSH79_06810 [Pseudomonas sp. FP2196]|uniref:hypothetical protein n=1 Tax=Pseudomonas sp. FP2196 TaxID=2954086 RepID=UPI002733025A|nr:hypothetical protein [Pseudomonas sp. FP2196]WLH36999.1 hypothetical protein PSH79_06810 [Pseudomonas sp. FP2196]
MRLIVVGTEASKGTGESAINGLFPDCSALAKWLTSNPSHKKTGHQGRFFLFLHPPSKNNVRQKFDWSG